MCRNRTQNKRHVPGFCKTLIDSWYGSLFGLESPRSSGHSVAQELKDGGHFEDHQTSEDHQIINSSHGSHSTTAENHCYWLLLGTLVDRTAFLVYLIIFIVMTFTYLL